VGMVEEGMKQRRIMRRAFEIDLVHRLPFESRFPSTDSYRRRSAETKATLPVVLPG
jgi:hypothetical protein